MKKPQKQTSVIALELFCLLLVCSLFAGLNHTQSVSSTSTDTLTSSSDSSDSKSSSVQKGNNDQKKDKDFIKWVDFTVPYEALCVAYDLDVESHDTDVPLNWIELLAYTAAKNGGTFSNESAQCIIQTAAYLSNRSTTIKKLTKDLKNYDYFLEAYTAVLGGYVGEYELETEPGSKKYEKHYGLKAFSPIAKGFPYGDFDDFGTARSYGYSRPHLGHDMMGQIGTPIIAVESGYVEALGWNQYGGWRIGIRSLDKKRYYYYAHLRQNSPFQKGLKEGSVVTAGDVIGYMGHTGYSKKENTNNIDEIHLHFGIQLIFDESQKDGNCEIWINPYQLTRFLKSHQSEAAKKGDSKIWLRVQDMKDPQTEDFTPPENQSAP